MNQAPDSFIQICGIAGIDKDMAQKKWLTVWEKSIQELLTSTINDPTTSAHELELLQVVFLEVKNGNYKDENVLDVLAKALDDDSQKEMTDRFAKLFTKNIDDFYVNLESQMTIEQKQVYNSFLEANNNV